MMVKRLAISLLAVCTWLLFVCCPAGAQDWFKTGTGLGVEKARVAVPEFAARRPSEQSSRARKNLLLSPPI